MRANDGGRRRAMEREAGREAGRSCVCAWMWEQAIEGETWCKPQSYIEKSNLPLLTHWLFLSISMSTSIPTPGTQHDCC